ncbi:hypothetical protein F5984_13160 [Rudanella paleaurantiibacter]|uniref:Uncharacterized protein n=1 Tax=Rudanella paleaurantiibacter TaxID=2614655 RepID=A0A7J5TY99_9BACT|nr:hypothetical protein [Rudanella paleaurantiibacter]KAB7730126.1 hypothetical protein F5984_13160 [Rudanella paleaurantiibacter]
MRKYDIYCAAGRSYWGCANEVDGKFEILCEEGLFAYAELTGEHLCVYKDNELVQYSIEYRAEHRMDFFNLDGVLVAYWLPRLNVGVDGAEPSSLLTLTHNKNTYIPRLLPP